jgi:predicted ATP-grasp superfamily ATP-dependent carboligase
LTGLPLTIVLDGNQRSALAVTRSLGRRGIPVAVADTHRESLAASSKFCVQSLEYPSPQDDAVAFTGWLKGLNESHPGAVLMPMTDVTVPLVLDASGEIPNLKTCLPTPRAYHAASDKYALAKLAADAGVRVPKTLRVNRGNAGEALAQEFVFPMVIKPRMSAMRLGEVTRKRGVRYAANRRELGDIVNQDLLDDSDELLVQEFVQGFGAGVFAIYDSGKPVFFFAHRRIREKPPSGGISVLCESVAVPESGRIAAQRLLDALAWHGVAMVEFKIDAAGTPWLIEINARLWGSLQLAVDAGADFPWLLYQLATDGRLEPPPHYEVGCRLRWWLGDLDNLYARLKDRRWTPGFGDKVRAVSEFLFTPPRTRNEFLRWQDPAPAWRELKGYVGSLFGAGH